MEVLFNFIAEINRKLFEQQERKKEAKLRFSF